MKRKTMLFCLGFALMLVGCASMSPDRVFQKSKENFIRTIEADLGQMDRRLARLLDGMENVYSDDETELNAQIVEVVREKNSVGRKLEYVRAATPDTWPYLKADLEEAVIDLEQLLKEIDKSMSLSYDGQSPE